MSPGRRHAMTQKSRQPMDSKQRKQCYLPMPTIQIGSSIVAFTSYLYLFLQRLMLEVTSYCDFGRACRPD